MITFLSLVFVYHSDRLQFLLRPSLLSSVFLRMWSYRCCRSMHYKKHEIRHQSTSALHHYRSATNSSTLKLNKPIKVKRLTQLSKFKTGTFFCRISAPWEIITFICSSCHVSFLLELADRNRNGSSLQCRRLSDPYDHVVLLSYISIVRFCANSPRLRPRRRRRLIRCDILSLV